MKKDSILSTSGLLECCTLVLLVFSLLSYLGNYFFLLDMLSHFRFQYLLVSIPAAAYFALRRSPRWCMLGLVCFMINGSEIAPWYLDGQEQSAASPRESVRILQLNLHVHNKSFSKVRNHILSVDADIVVLLELTPPWPKKIKEIEKVYPHRFVEPSLGAQGLAVYSKLPLGDANTMYLPGTTAPTFAAEIALGSKAVKLIVLHPWPPRGRARVAAHARHIREVQHFLKEVEQPVLLMGDLNMTMFSPLYKSFIAETDLYNTRNGMGLLRTWYPWFGGGRVDFISWLLALSIDHFLVSEQFVTEKMELGPYLGSDHLPVFVELSL